MTINCNPLLENTADLTLKNTVGLAVVGVAVGIFVGDAVGWNVGIMVGREVEGLNEGNPVVGSDVGDPGRTVG